MYVGPWTTEQFERAGTSKLTTGSERTGFSRLDPLALSRIQTRLQVFSHSSSTEHARTVPSNPYTSSDIASSTQLSFSSDLCNQESLVFREDAKALRDEVPLCMWR